MFQLSHFFGTQVVPPSDLTPENRLTVIRVAERTDEGVVFMNRCVEHDLSGKQALDYQDYQINNLLDAGITPKAIHLKSDIRIGSDKIIKEFNDRVDELAEKMFNS